jgi:hypothetical protein
MAELTISDWLNSKLTTWRSSKHNLVEQLLFCRYSDIQAMLWLNQLIYEALLTCFTDSGCERS